jgi:hypothetical protein
MIPTEKQTVTVPDWKRGIQVFLGDPKVGKSTFIAQNPTLLVLDCDNNGAQYVDCFRVAIHSWADLQQTLKELADLKKEGKLTYTTLGIDTVNGAYQLCRAHVLKELKLAHESDDKGFGRSWDIVKNTFIRFVSYVQSLGLGLWMTSHTQQKEVKIQGVKRLVTTSALSNSIANTVFGMADHIFYINTNEDGSRTCYTTPQDSLETGGRLNRFGLNQDIRFTTENELYEKIESILYKKEEKE